MQNFAAVFHNSQTLYLPSGELYCVFSRTLPSTVTQRDKKEKLRQYGFVYVV